MHITPRIVYDSINLIQQDMGIVGIIFVAIFASIQFTILVPTISRFFYRKRVICLMMHYTIIISCAAKKNELVNYIEYVVGNGSLLYSSLIELYGGWIKRIL